MSSSNPLILRLFVRQRTQCHKLKSIYAERKRRPAELGLQFSMMLHSTFSSVSSSQSCRANCVTVVLWLDMGGPTVPDQTRLWLDIHVPILGMVGYDHSDLAKSFSRGCVFNQAIKLFCDRLWGKGANWEGCATLGVRSIRGGSRGLLLWTRKKGILKRSETCCCYSVCILRSEWTLHFGTFFLGILIQQQSKTFWWS